ncbi:MAG TPA: hypothetical protein VN205_04535 [Thermomonas sp.]|nr:hypothetical protein [Thermomonas sp.]
MQHRKLSIALAGVMLAVASFGASADILFQNLGTSAPPATIGGHSLQQFDQAPQSALAEYSTVGVVPGNPVAGDLTLSPSGSKYTASGSWGSAPWPGSYTGAIYLIASTTGTLSLPANTKAFYFYTQGNQIGTNTITATTDSGTTSGPIAVYSNFGAEGATGFAFYTTAGESITSITINTSSSSGFAIGEFAINAGPTITCASEGYTGTKLEWCKNICERGYTGATLNMWIRRWVDRYRQLPYCALAPQPVPTLR